MGFAIIVHDDDRFFEEEEESDESALVCYASDAAHEMALGMDEELDAAVVRAGNSFIALGIPTRGHFKRIYRCTDDGIYRDWKLSELAYRFVCLNGNCLNPHVAEFQHKLIAHYFENRNSD